MTQFTLYSIDTAPEASKTVLGNVQKGFGFVPNLMRVIAESPTTLEAYTTLMRLFEKSAFDTTEKEVIVLAVAMKTLSNYVNHAADTPIDQALAA